jgi:penicillin-binding protein 1C
MGVGGQRARAALRRVAFALAALPLLAAAAFAAWPLPRGLLERRPAASVRFTDRDGGLLREVASRGDGRSVGLPADEPVPPLVRQAFLAAEDRRFERHFGVDPLALARAAWQDLRARRVVSGASTITQQLARQLVPRPRTLAGKLREALWAVRLTAHLSREAILRAYLDRVALGRDLYGVEAAAQLYFGRPARSLSAGQAALLAGMARSPARCDPHRHPEQARARMAEVLAHMRDLGFLDAEAMRVAREAPLDLVPAAHAFRAPHLVEQLLRDLPALGLDGAAVVETALDAALQADAEELLRAELSRGRVEQAAAIVLDNDTGEVLAYVGSADFLDDDHLGQNDGVRALRQPGSALKPFAYGLALSAGYTPASLLSDLEVHLATPGGDYVPRNYDRRVHGPVRLRAALANSYNVPAVALADALGPDRVLAVLRAAGLASLGEEASHYGVGLVLGNGDVTLRELARAYRGLARGGVVEPLAEARAARDAWGRPMPVAAELAPRRSLPAAAVALLTDVLSDEAARAPAFGLDNALRLPFRVAVKTGTSRAYVDNWTVGFTAERTVAVWAGNFDGRPMRGVSGVSGAGPIFGRIMARAMRGIAPRPLVDAGRFEHARVCALSGKLAGPSCPSSLEERFLPGTAPAESCPMHRRRAGAASADAPAVLDVGPAFYAWARAEGLSGGPWLDSEEAAPGPAEAQILLPRDGDEYLVEAGLPAEAQAIPLRLRAAASSRPLEARTDDGAVVPLAPPFVARLPARPGRHRVEIWEPGGAAPLASARFVVHGVDAP